MPEPPLLAALAEAARLLEVGDAEGAAQALAHTDALCNPSVAGIDREALEEARRRLSRCYLAQQSLREQVVSGLEQLAAVRRAEIYRGETRR